MIRASFEQVLPTLYLVSTPIGNLKDITLRALETLNAVQVIFAEDTRNTLKLLTHYDIKKPLKRYDEHTKLSAVEHVLAHLEAGDSVALVTDAGTPGISDPGFELVVAVKEKFPVIAIPGASAILTALVASGLAPQPFTFYGFLSRSKAKQLKELDKLSGLPHTLVFYERGDRIKDTLENILDRFGNREIVLAKELTKQYETFFEGDIKTILDLDFNQKGEFVLLCSGKQADVMTSGDMVKDVIEYIHLGYDEKSAIKKVAKDYGVVKNDVYQAVIKKGGIKHD